MQQRSINWSENNLNPSIRWIPDIVFNFRKVLILRTTLLKFSEYFDGNFIQTSDLTFVASEFKILFLQL